MNRTIYRSPAFEGANAAFLWHLRNKRPELNAEEAALKDEFNLKIVYPEEMFYKTHKVTQKDFLEKLREASNDAELKDLINGLFEDDSVCGRRGVKTLRQGCDIVKSKVATRER